MEDTDAEGVGHWFFPLSPYGCCLMAVTERARRDNFRAAALRFRIPVLTALNRA